MVALIINLQSNSEALNAAAVSVEKNGFPVPAAKITILFLSRCLIALLLMYGSAIWDIVIADCTLVGTLIFTLMSNAQDPNAPVITFLSVDHSTQQVEINWAIN